MKRIILLSVAFVSVLSCNQDLVLDYTGYTDFLVINETGYNNAPLDFRFIAPIMNDDESVEWEVNGNPSVGSRAELDVPISAVEQVRSVRMRILNGSNVVFESDTSLTIRPTPTQVEIVGLTLISDLYGTFYYNSEDTTSSLDVGAELYDAETNELIAQISQGMINVPNCTKATLNHSTPILWDINRRIRVELKEFYENLDGVPSLQDMSLGNDLVELDRQEYLIGGRGQRYPSKIPGNHWVLNEDGGVNCEYAAPFAVELNVRWKL